MEERRDYNREFKEEIEKARLYKKKPTLFLHACCGPCLTYPLSALLPYFDVTVGYFNPNIQPLSEYYKRRDTLLSFVSRYGKDRGQDISVVLPEEDFEKYRLSFLDRKDDAEGGEVCLRCHRYRMELAYQYASSHHFDYFTTVMTVSSKKPSREINEIGEELSRKFPGTKYLFSDFKKENGQLLGIRIAKAYSLYRQDYCGCLFSLAEREKEKRNRSRNGEKED
ncbi:MAG: epoxyqueuosine reductase QueH [Bacilli bacterium]